MTNAYRFFPNGCNISDLPLSGSVNQSGRGLRFKVERDTDSRPSSYLCPRPISALFLPPPDARRALVNGSIDACRPDLARPDRPDPTASREMTPVTRHDPTRMVALKPNTEAHSHVPYNGADGGHFIRST